MSLPLFEVRHFENVSSTNDRAAEWLARGARDGATVIADAQNRGRGRLGRSWYSPPGVNIYLSQVFLGPPTSLAWLPLLGALAVREAVSGCLYAPLAVRIKWPNDIEVLDYKVAGILAEGVSGERSGGILGIGINVNMRAADFPPGLRRPAVSLAMLNGRYVSRERVLGALLIALQRWRQRWREQPALLLSEYARHCATLGHNVAVELPSGEVVRGLARTLEGAGYLVLECDQGRRITLAAGEATLLMDRQPPS